MKIIEAMRGIRALNEKIADLVVKIKKHAADTDNVTPTYETEEKQEKKIIEWLDCHKEAIKTIEHLRLGIQNTNIQTKVTVEIGGNTIVKTVAGWIHRRRDLHKLEAIAWTALNADGLRTGSLRDDTTQEIVAVNIRRYYDLELRDKKLAVFQEEPHLIDAALEISNATTEVIFID